MSQPASPPGGPQESTPESQPASPPGGPQESTPESQPASPSGSPQESTPGSQPASQPGSPAPLQAPHQALAQEIPVQTAEAAPLQAPHQALAQETPVQTAEAAAVQAPPIAPPIAPPPIAPPPIAPPPTQGYIPTPAQVSAAAYQAYTPVPPPYQPPPQPLPPILHCQNLTKSYGPFPALGPVSLDAYPGRIIGLLGPNGSGKTTFIKTVAGLLTPSYGQVRVCGYTPGVESKSLVSYLPERTYLGNWMKVSDALDYFESFYADFSRERAIDMLARLQVPLFARISKLSRGTKEKVQLILVMARQAKLYLLDEPIAGVDPAARDYILDTIISNYDRRATIIISTHLISDVEKTLDDYIFLNRGQVVSAGAVASVYQAGWSSLDACFREAFKC